MSNPAKLLLAGPIARATVPSPVDWRHWLKLSLAKTLGVLSFTPLTMLQACAQAVDFKVGHHFGEGQYKKLLKQRERRLRWAEKTGTGFTLPGHQQAAAEASNGKPGKLLQFRKVG